MVGASQRRTVAGALAAAALLVIGLVTLWPVSTFVPTPLFCVFCGPLGGVDFTLNLALFVPLGLCLRWLTSWRRATLIGIGVTLSIELLQWQLIPGRDASVGDVVANALGTLLGAWLAAVAPRWLTATGQAALRQSAASGVIAAVVLIASAVLLRPASPPGGQFVQWTPVRPTTVPFTGRLISAELNSRSLPPHDVVTAQWLDETVGSHFRVGVRIEAPVAASDRRAIIVRIANSRHEGFVFAQIGNDVLFRTNVLAAQLRFRPPLLRLENGLAAATPGAAIHLLASSTPDAMTLRSDQGAARRETVLPRTVGMGWSLIAPREIALDAAWWPVNAVWLALVVFPVGFFAKRSGHSPAGVRYWLPLLPVVAALVGATTVVGLSAPGPGESVGLLAGATGTWWMERLSRRDTMKAMSDRTTELIES